MMKSRLGKTDSIFKKKEGTKEKGAIPNVLCFAAMRSPDVRLDAGYLA